jgi:hypothetical protein
MARIWTMVLIAALAGCGSLAGLAPSDVEIATNPENSHCVLKGRDFTAEVDTPAKVAVPVSAAPVSVTCTAEGRRPTVFSLRATGSGWSWGNSALIGVTAGGAVLGLLFDETTGGGNSYARSVKYDLDPDRPRAVHTNERGGERMILQAR